MPELRTKPQIRFAGFTDAWEQRKLGEFVEFYSGLTYSPKNVTNSGTLVLRSSNVKDGEIINADNVYVNPDVATSENVCVGDVIVVVRNGSRNLIGKHAQIKRSMANTVIGAFMTGVRSDVPEFTNVLLSTQQFSVEIEKNLGATINQITTGEFKKMPFFVPSAKEQSEIGAFFAVLDRLIPLHQREYNKTVNIKKAMLEKMFPKNGEDRPEIRFAGFTDAWEQRKLGELMEVGSVKRIHQSDWTDNGVRFLRARDIVSAAKGEESVDYLYITQEKYDEYSAISGKVKMGDLLVTGVGSIGVPMLIDSDKPLYFKDGNIIWFKNENRTIDGQFLYYSFIGRNIQQFIRDVAGIGTVGTYTIESGKKTPIRFPTKNEQTQIASFFAALDRLIIIHQRELIKLQNVKKSLLEKMFV